jgi:predicted translin family RNA/ssDNA-binding protein
LQEEYLFGIILLPSELSRFAVTSVTHNDYFWPVKILDFSTLLFQNFQLLNLKNDGLRRKYDSIKYDLQRIESCVYDLRIRKLI